MGGSADKGRAASRVPLCDGAMWQDVFCAVGRTLLKGYALWAQSVACRRRYLLLNQIRRNGAPLGAHPFQLSRYRGEGGGEELIVGRAHVEASPVDATRGRDGDLNSASSKGGEMLKLFLAFCQNMGNVKRKGGRQRTPQQELIADWNSALSSAEPTTLSFVNYYRHTGNYILRTSGSSSTCEVMQILTECIPSYFFAVFDYDEFLRIRTEACNVFETNPLFVTGRRPTPGLVMDLDPNGNIPGTPPPNAKFEIGSFAVPRIRNAWKKDILGPGGKTLDRTRREGGWGWLSTYFRTRCGGSWTARSMSTVDGLIAKAQNHEARCV